MTNDVGILLAVPVCVRAYFPIRHFWTAFDTLSQEDRRRLVSFAYGRSRLPRNYGDLQHRFKLTVLNPSGNPDNYLPLAHTCFFHIELPRYTSPDICRAKLLIAIYS
jgi:E3 ubiquitin-protein ligase HERC2